MWRDFWVACALMLVMEGIWPFLSPESFRQTLLNMVDQSDTGLRIVGLISMLSGVVLLYWVH
ncbi:DUF2065 domain-containing protein [Gammaproteobacteria bacterium]